MNQAIKGGGRGTSIDAAQESQPDTLPAAIASITLDRASPVPLYQQLGESLRSAINSGELWPGLLLPTTYRLAAALGVARKTVVAAYSRLTAEGLLTSNTRRGTRVAPISFSDERRVPEVQTSGAPSQPEDTIDDEISYRAQQLLDATDAGEPGKRVQSPDPSMYPRAQLARLLGREFYRAALPAAASSRNEFQSAISSWLRHTRGVLCEPAQVIPVRGLESAVEIIAKILIEPGHTAYVENPGDDCIVSALRFAGAQIVPIPVDAQGANLGCATGPPARLMVVSPSLNFPLGGQMSEVRRLATLSASERSGAFVLEIDRGSELLYWGLKFKSLQGYAPGARVLYFGSLFETLGPHIKLGYLVVPLMLVDAFLKGAQDADIVIEPFILGAVAKFIEDGSLASHIQTVRSVYARRLTILVDTCRRLLPNAVLAEPAGGLSLAMEYPQGLNEDQICSAGQSDGMALAPLSRFFLPGAEPGPAGIVIGAGALAEENIPAMVERIAKLVNEIG